VIDSRNLEQDFREKPVSAFSHPAQEHVPEKWTRFSDKDMLPKFLNWREFFSIR
jgi:hypothetical protein